MYMRMCTDKMQKVFLCCSTVTVGILLLQTLKEGFLSPSVILGALGILLAAAPRGSRPGGAPWASQAGRVLLPALMLRCLCPSADHGAG